MKFKGTQGNWYLTATPTQNCVSIRSDNGEYIGFLSLNVVRPALMPEQKPINEANAKLISKSPELLEALKDAVTLLEKLDCPDHLLETYANFIGNTFNLIQDSVTP